MVDLTRLRLQINASYVGWACYTGMVLIIAYVRISARQAYNVYGVFSEKL